MTNLLYFSVLDHLSDRGNHLAESGPILGSRHELRNWRDLGQLSDPRTCGAPLRTAPGVRRWTRCADKHLPGGNFMW